MPKMPEKSYLFIILLLLPITSIAQIMKNLETKHLPDVLALENQMFRIDSDTTLTETRVEYYDGYGNLVYLFEYDYDLEQSKHYLKQYDAPFLSLNAYTDGKMDTWYAEKRLNDSTYSLEFFAYDSLYVSTNIFLNAQTILVLPDSTRVEMKFDDQHNFTEKKYVNKNGEMDVIFKYKILESDRNGNWTKRFESVISDTDKRTTLHQRKIKYNDEYETSNYFELTVDTLIWDGQLISDPESLKPKSDNQSADRNGDEALLSEKEIYQAFKKLFFVKYFNPDYFLGFSIDQKGAKEVLKDRLLYYNTTHVFDIRNGKYYSGRTNSKRWFDKTASLNRLEGLESPPMPTERWVEINGYNCREYIKPAPSGKTDRFYVTEELPFINYSEFTFTLPGFVMKSEREIPILGALKLVVDIKKCTYPFHFLEFVKDLNEKYGTEIMYLRKKEK